ncbi:hypothetical protein [Kitasatospora kifunensis]|uniref:Uncharacterized protein n=1 Tax=Kitasatospora kifunensis TaxID=58351 RepID=A0A7W7R903_KITKI|nr:hypothetical protein [Kitasatospora kifunensis]MBB4927655.1 hypothetical protein [Kitasatospora kifunensis]
MAEILVEENFAHIDGSDMNVILDLLDELALEAEPTAPRSSGRGRQWELTMHWQQATPVPADIEAALPAVVARIRDHFQNAGKQLPARVALYNRDALLLRTFEPDAR